MSVLENYIITSEYYVKKQYKIKTKLINKK